MPQSCQICHKKATTSQKLFDCSACKQISYCGVEHQREDWNTHKTECAKVQNCLKNGIFKETIQEGTGDLVQKGKRVKVHYVGTLVNGNKFDSSRDRNDPLPVTVGLGQVIRGWDDGLLTFKVGERSKLYISPSWGYGSQDMGDIPPNSVLIFDMELISIQ
jgi:FKBP-type peptidyl-prolyl cis-trans isomerase